MIEYLREICQAITEVPAREAMGGLAVAVGLAVAGSQGCVLLRKRTSDPLPSFCGLILLISFASMAIGFGHSKSEAVRSERWLAKVNPSEGVVVTAPPIGRGLIEAADLDGDHRLTAEEAARFVARIDRSGKGWADAFDVDQARQRWIVPRPIQDFYPHTPRRDGDFPGE